MMKHKKVIAAVISAALILTAALCLTPAIAKYVTTQGKQSEVISDEFYFTSDYLQTGEVPEYAISGNSVTFSLQNFMDSLRVCPSDITYTVTATDGTLTPSGGTLTGGNAASDKITLSYTGAGARKEITVTATGSGTYEQVLRAKFIFSLPGLQYEIKDQPNSYYAELYIYTDTAVDALTLTWDKEKLLIDETNGYIFGQMNGEKTGATVSIAADTTVKILFFKTDITQNYTQERQSAQDTIAVTSASG